MNTFELPSVTMSTMTTRSKARKQKSKEVSKNRKEESMEVQKEIITVTLAKKGKGKEMVKAMNKRR